MVGVPSSELAAKTLEEDEDVRSNAAEVETLKEFNDLLDLSDLPFPDSFVDSSNGQNNLEEELSLDDYIDESAVKEFELDCSEPIECGLKDEDNKEREEDTVTVHRKEREIGVVSLVLGKEVVIKGREEDDIPLSKGSVVYITETRSQFGFVNDVIRNVGRPYYVIRFNTESEVPQGLTQGTSVSFVDYKKGNNAATKSRKMQKKKKIKDDDEDQKPYLIIEPIKRTIFDRLPGPSISFVGRNSFNKFFGGIGDLSDLVQVCNAAGVGHTKCPETNASRPQL